MVELYLTADCSGIPRAAGPAKGFATGFEVPLPTGKGVTGEKLLVHAVARDPEHGGSACSDGVIVALPAPPTATTWQDLGLESAGDERALWKRVLAAQTLLQQSVPPEAWARLAQQAPGFVPVGTLSLSLGKAPRFLAGDLNGDGVPDPAILGVARASALGAALSSGATPVDPGPLLVQLRNLRAGGGAGLRIGLSGGSGVSWVSLPGGSGLVLVPRWAEKPPGCDAALPSRADVAWARDHRCDALELDGSDTDPVRYLLWDQRTRALLALDDKCEK